MLVLYPIRMPRPFLTFLALAIGAATAACSRPAREPALSPEAYRETVTAFYVGVSAMQTTQEVLAREKFDRVVALAPQEPAGLANLGLLLVRQQDLDGGSQQLAKAAALAPDSGALQRLQALTEGRRGNLAQAVTHWRKALAIDPQDREAAYALALDLERQGGATNEAEAQRVLEELLGRGENLAVRIEQIRIAAKRGDSAALMKSLAALRGSATAWSPEAQSQLTAVTTAASGDARAAGVRVAFLKNVLLREPAYRAALGEVTIPGGEIGRPLMRFLRLENPKSQPAAPDRGLTFPVERVAGAPPSSWAGTIVLDENANPAIVSVGASGARIAGVSGELACKGATTAVAADVNYDFRVDLVVAGAGGLCLFRNAGDGRFTDVTSATKLPPAILRRPLYAVWVADIDTDGDLDLVLAPRDGHPIVARNNGDGTFTARDLFSSVSDARAFVWADLDGEGVPDAAFLDDAGAIHVFLNLRDGAFRAEPVPIPSGNARPIALATADLNGDAIFDLITIGADMSMTWLSRAPRSGTWQMTKTANVLPEGLYAEGSVRLFVADLDNNGAADLVITAADGSRILLGAGGGFNALPNPAPILAYDIADLDGDGKLDLVGLDADDRPVRAMTKGATSYRWTALHPRAATATGDQRINSFGIGGEIEVRSGLHLQKQIITSPIVHVGLGEAASAEIVRITWPNGTLQAEFDATAGRTIKATQRLKGSCPWLFAWNGREMSFVTDLIWRSPLGLRINAQATADTLMTEDWVKVRGDQLAPRDGVYHLRITAELWETHFFDLVSMMAVDHPRDTEIFVDERFAVPPPKLQVIATGPVQTFASVKDDHGGDLSAAAAAIDDRMIDFAGRGPYQGITRPHFVEMELPDAAPRTGPLWLIARGWVHPTDSSVNVAISQGRHAAPHGLSLHVADAAGRFREVRSGLGFPAGKDKTVLIDLSGMFAASGPRRLRLATNLEIFWDRLGWAVGRPDVAIQSHTLDVLAADLSYRGYSVTTQPSSSVPERPRYALDGTGQRWRDLEGYYTRFGDVRELLRAVDDRYVIMNAGDEIRLKFREIPGPASGLVRDFVFKGDGWVKDGDYNTTFSRTVLPLPTHRTGRYDTPPGQLEDDPVYREHQRDFAEYHTRYVATDSLRQALTDASRPHP
jgi:Tfp pilus assembly protein PilF